MRRCDNNNYNECFILCSESGKSFGEVALLSDNAERNASIVADMDNMDLLVVDRELYSRTIRVCETPSFTTHNTSRI